MNKIRETIIEDYGYDGEGVGKVDGKICFIPYVIKNEKVRFEIVKENSSFCFGKVLNVIENSPKRQKPRCPYFAVCGGCSYQHVDYNDEIDIKKELLKRQLNKIGYQGNIEVVRSPQIYGYRNKIRLFVGRNKVGLKQRNSDVICDIDDCDICKDLIGRAIKPIKEFIHGYSLYDKIKNIILRQENNKCLINFVLYDDYAINYQGLFLILGQDYGIFQTFNNHSTHVYGIKSLETEEFNLKCKFSPFSFHQVNGKVCEFLYNTVLKNVQGKVINCYSGNGVLSGIISQKSQVVGVELGEFEHNEAQELRDRNRLKNLVNIKGDCAKILPNLDGDTLIVDPPRSGMSEKVCEEIQKKKFQRFIYISCNSATLTRDLKRLPKYKIEKVYLFDMFARTGEYECLVILKNIL